MLYIDSAMCRYRCTRCNKRIPVQWTNRAGGSDEAGRWRRTKRACGRCGTTRYCSRDCHMKHWQTHKPDCVPRYTAGWEIVVYTGAPHYARAWARVPSNAAVAPAPTSDEVGA